MKTFEQFKEESDKFGIKKTMNNFMQNQNVQNLFTNMKGGNLNIKDLQSIVNDKKFINNTRNQSIDALAKGANMVVNQLTSTLKKIPDSNEMSNKFRKAETGLKNKLNDPATQQKFNNIFRMIDSVAGKKK